MNCDDWHRLYREEEDYEYLEYVDKELKRLRRKYHAIKRVTKRNR